MDERANLSRFGALKVLHACADHPPAACLCVCVCVCVCACGVLLGMASQQLVFQQLSRLSPTFSPSIHPSTPSPIISWRPSSRAAPPPLGPGDAGNETERERERERERDGRWGC